MLAFHVRLFAVNSYFIQTLFTSTLSILFLQALVASHADGAESEIWIRAAIIGSWTVSSVATGLIGFQRYQGTLVYLVVSDAGPAKSLVPVVASASVFAIAAFPLSLAVSIAIGLPVSVNSVWAFIVAVLVFLIGTTSMCLVIAALFVLTPNAIAYESIVAIPIVLLSGVFFDPTTIGPFGWITRVFPITSAVQILKHPEFDSSFGRELLISIAVSLVWLAAGFFAGRLALRAATRTGTLEMT